MRKKSIKKRAQICKFFERPSLESLIVENAVYEISGLKTLLFIFCLLLPSHLEASSYSNSESIQKEQILDNFSNIPTLQMNPATLEEVTEGVGTLKKELGFSEVSEGSSAGGAVNQAVSSTVIESSPSIRSTLDKTSPSLVSSDPTERVKIEKLQIKVKLERAAKLEEQANQAYVAAKLEEANSWKSAGECLRTSVASMMKAMKARNSENIPLAEYCASEAEKLEQAAELMVEGAQAYAAGNREVGCDWHLAGDCIQKSTKIMRQSREAADAENAVLAESYAIEAEKLEEAATLCIQGAHADLAKKIEEGKSWGLAGLNIRLSSGTMIKAIKARVSGRESLAKNYEIEAKKWEQAAELMKKAAQTYAAGKAAEGSCLFWAGEYISNSAEIMIKAMEAQNSELSAQELLFTSSSDTTRLFRGSVEYEYRLLERAAEFMIRGAQAYAAEKELEGKSWELAGSYTNERLEIMTKAAQAHATRNVSLVESYTEVAKELEKATEFMVQGAEAYAAKKETAGQDWYSAGQYMKGSAETMIKGIGASISGKVILGKSYTAEAKKLEQAAELMKRAAHANAAEKEVEESMLVWAGHLTQESAGTMIKAIEAREAGNASLGERYTLEAKKSERAAELMKQGIQAYGEGTQEKIATSWYWAGHYTQVSAETMLKGIEASISRKGLLEKNYTTEAKKSEQAAKLMKKAAKAYAAGNEREGSMWERTGELTQTSAKTMIKAIQARVGENISLAESYATEAKKLEQAAELTIQIAQTYVAEKKFEGNIWYQAQYIQASAEMMLQAIKMRTSGDSSLADSYTAEAKKLEEAATLMKKAVQAYAAGRELEGNSWSFASQYMQESAKIMLQAIETRITEDTSLIESYVVEAHKLEQVAGLYIQGAQAYSVREEEENSWSLAGQYMQSSIEATIKAIEACTSGDSSLAERYSVEAKKSEQATELMKQAAQAYKMGKNLEGFSWYLIGKCTEQSSAIMLKAIEARIAGSIPLAESYTEEAQKLEEALELIQQAVKAFEAGKVYEGDNLELIGLSIHESVETMIKAIEARIEGNASLAENYTIEIKKLERAIGLMKQAVEALKAGKASEGHKWRFIGESVRESATMMINAIEAKKVGDVFLAEIFTIEAKKSERAVELAEQANQANAVEKKLEARDLMLASVCMRLSAQRMMLAIDARNEEDEELFKKYRAEAKELEQCSHIFEDNELTQEISNSEYEEKQSGADQPCVENNELPLKSQGDDKTFTTQTDLEIIEGIEGEYLFPRIGGGFYRGQWYKQHALERMAPKTPEMKALLFDRAIKRAQRAGLNIDTDLLENRYDDPLALKAYLNKNASLKAWWSQNGPQLRAIPPSLVEQEIAHPGTTKLDVRMSEEGDIITTFFNRRKIKRVSRSPLNI